MCIEHKFFSVHILDVNKRFLINLSFFYIFFTYALGEFIKEEFIKNFEFFFFLEIYL